MTFINRCGIEVGIAMELKHLELNSLNGIDPDLI